MSDLKITLKTHFKDEEVIIRDDVFSILSALRGPDVPYGSHREFLGKTYGAAVIRSYVLGWKYAEIIPPQAIIWKLKDLGKNQREFLRDTLRNTPYHYIVHIISAFRALSSNLHHISELDATFCEMMAMLWEKVIERQRITFSFDQIINIIISLEKR